ncbi:MAG: cation transporter, partial [Clostridia bacterium]|nr:cation transporter [Clostridia bacterium]
MKKYNVTGMSCAACSARVEKAVSAVEGVESCSVNLLTNSMNIEGTADDNAVIAAVKAAGYGAEPVGAGGKVAKEEKNSESVADGEIATLKKRFFASLGFLVILMYVSMGHAMWGWPLPSFLVHNPLATGLVQLLLTIVVMVINQKFFISGFKALIKRAPNMDTLVALGSGAAFGYSIYAMFAMTAAQTAGDTAAVHHYM